MKDYTEFAALVDRVMHKYNQWEGQKRCYGTDMLLSRSEIHTIVAVGDHPGINITTLAHILGITKGAASQMIYKLVEKGVVNKSVSPDSDTEVVLQLTERGLINYRSHQAYHQQNNDDFFSLLKDMPAELYTQLFQALSAFEGNLDDRLKK